MEAEWEPFNSLTSENSSSESCPHSLCAGLKLHPPGEVQLSLPAWRRKVTRMTSHQAPWYRSQTGRAFQADINAAAGVALIWYQLDTDDNREILACAVDFIYHFTLGIFLSPASLGAYLCYQRQLKQGLRWLLNSVLSQWTKFSFQYWPR